MTPVAPARRAPSRRASVASAALAIVAVVTTLGGASAHGAGAQAKTPEPRRTDVAAPTGAPPTPVRFTLAGERTTSAGVYDLDGMLLRTLLSSRRLARGAHEAVWDGRDDEGREVERSTVEVRLVEHRLAYRWDGVVGNTSSSFTGAGVHRSLFFPGSIAIAGGTLAYATGYSEGQSGARGFRLGAPQIAVTLQSRADAFAGWHLVDGDGRRWYWANGGGLSRVTFVAASDASTGEFVPFAAGRDVCLNRLGDRCYPVHEYRGVIDVEPDAGRPTGLAVQRQGAVLAVARADGAVRLYDKRSGAPLGAFQVASRGDEANRLAFAPGGDLWVIAADRVDRYSGLPDAPHVVATLRGPDRPLAVAVHPSDPDFVVVAYGGARATLQAFHADGRERWRIDGGAADDPEVRPGRIGFLGHEGRDRTALAVAPDGIVWVVDSANHRIVAFEATGRVVDDVAWLPASYCTTVDAHDSRRVFANFLEYTVRPDVPLRPGRNGGWTLVRNWRAGLPQAAVDGEAVNRGFGGLHTVTTLPGGRTLAVTRARGQQWLLELPAHGPAKLLGRLPAARDGETPPVLERDGAVTWARNVGASQIVLTRALLDLDSKDGPTWGAPRELARADATETAPVDRGAFSGVAGPRFPRTSVGDVLFFDGSVAPRRTPQFHLGAVGEGGRTWRWRAAAAGSIDVPGAFQTRDVDPGVQYGGSRVAAWNRHVVYGYHGEGFRDPSNGRTGQANRFEHYLDDGLHLGAFGVPTTRANGEAAAGVAGNSFAFALVPDRDALLVYHNDESQHGGVHRWTLAGLGTVRERVARGAPGTPITIP